MTTPSGTITMADIQTEFGGTNPISLSEYYAAASGVPASGTISMNDLRNKSSADTTPDAVDWANINPGNSVGTTATKTITGITATTTITFSVTAGFGVTAVKNGTGGFSSPITVVNNDTLAFTVTNFLVSGSTKTVTVNASGVLLDTFTATLLGAVQKDNL